MPATVESRLRTRTFARIIGPYLVIVPGILAVRASDIASIFASFFQNPALIWIMGAWLLFSGLLIIAYHQYWSSAAAVTISLIGWFLAIRGLILLAVPDLIQRGAETSMRMLPAVRTGFAIFALIGLWLTYVGWVRRPPAS